MRKALRKELIACFKREFEARFTRFTLFDEERHAWTWAWKITPQLSFFVMLQAFESKDQFVLEVCWSEDGEFPWGAMGKTKIDRPQGRERLGGIWRQGKEDPPWDIAPEVTAAMREGLEALARGESPKYPPYSPVEQIVHRVGPLVHDAVARFERDGLPLFRRVAEARGVEWPHD